VDMHDNDEQAPTKGLSRSRRVWLAVASTLAIVIVAVIVWVNASEPEEAVAPTETTAPANPASSVPSPQPSPAPSRATESLDAEAGTSAVEALLEAVAGVVNGEQALEALSPYATGALVEEYRVSAEEFANNGWRQEGTPVVVSSEVVSQDPAANPPTAVLQVCLDSSGVQVYDADGEPQRDLSSPQRSLNIFGLQLSDGSWKLASLTFPDQPDC
jgi:flagellar basal body-associated protein FliL